MKTKSSFHNISSGMAVSSLGISVSRISGLVRDIMFAKYWGTGNALGAFLVAFTIPNLFRRIFGEGALSEAFVPVFTEELSKNGKQSAFQLAYNVLTVLTLILVVIVGFGILACGVFDSYVPDPFAQLTLRLSKILLPYTIFVCISAILAGMLHSLNHYAMPALSPIILNCLIILTLVYICPRLGPNEFDKLIGLAGAVLLAGVLQLVLLIIVLMRFGFFFQFSTRLRSPQIVALTKLVLPGVFSASITQLNVLIDRIFATWLGGFAVTSLYYSERIIYLPIGVFGVALATSCLPEFSRAFAEDKIDDMIAAFYYSIRQILYLTLPFVLLIMMLAGPIVRLIYQRGTFGNESAIGTISAIMFYAPGIPAFATVKILRAGFFSRKDTVTPAKVGCYCLILNVILNIVLIVPLKHCGLALATTISSYANTILLAIILYRTVRPTALPFRDLLPALMRICLATAVVSIVVWGLVSWIGNGHDNSLFTKFYICFIPLVIGGGSYILISVALGSKEPRELYAVLASKRRKKRP